MSNLAVFQDLHTRWASPENPAGQPGAAHGNDDGRKRRASLPVAVGQVAVLADVAGSPGTVRRIWITISQRDPATLRSVRLRMFWDGAATPAVDAPLGDFFGHGLGRMTVFENELFSSPEGKSFVCVAPMPFHSGMRIELVNESTAEIAHLFYDVDYTLGDAHGPDMLYFHAHWRRERPTTMRRDFAFLPQVHGRGRFLGALVSVIPDTIRWARSWWGEGEMKAYIDSDTSHPTLCGTGTEDWIGTGWGQGQFIHRYQGCTIADQAAFRFAFYRLHVPDPIFFRSGIRVEMQQIGWAHAGYLQDMQRLGTQLTRGDETIDIDAVLRGPGKCLFEREDDWASCAWFYLDRAENGLPGLAEVGERVAKV